MGQKINPFSFRVGVTKPWPVRWFAKGGFGKFLEEDEAIRNIVNEKVSLAGISAIEIERTPSSLRILIRVARPGFVIGRGGKGVEDLTKAIEKAVTKVRGKKVTGISLNIEELKRSEISAQYVGQQMAWDIEKRIGYRRTMKKYLEQVLQNREVKGVKIKMSGRLDGNEISRREWMGKGRLPLHTLRANIDYGEVTAFTTYGAVGIKVWIYKGEIFDKEEK
jgi:small subunit ribosomal protein S3